MRIEVMQNSVFITRMGAQLSAKKWGDREQAILFVTGVTFITNKS